MVDRSFVHNGYKFRCIAEDWPDEESALESCRSLTEAVETLARDETADLYSTLVQSGDAYGDDPIWQSQPLVMLFRFREFARRAAMQRVLENSDWSEKCSCRIIPVLSD